MAVYVVLEFDNDEEAKEFVTTAIDDRICYKNADIFGVTEINDARPVAVYKRPTQFCECTSGRGARSWTRGKKYGWWVHAACGKPSKAWGKRDGWYTVLGTNLIPRSKLANEGRPQGWESSAQWNFLKPYLETKVEA